MSLSAADFTPDLEAARIRLHADIDHACAAELRRAREAGEHARRSLGQLVRWMRVALTMGAA